MKKIIIFTSIGGGGHISASKALETYLKNDYDIHCANIFENVLKSLDFVRILTLNKYSGEDLYNYLIAAKKFRLLGKVYSLGNWYINTLQKKRIIAALSTYITKHKPDLIISVVPIINDNILIVAQKYAIPFLSITTDLDVTTYLSRIKNPTYDAFFVTAAFDDPSILQPFITAGIATEKITIAGALLQPDFFEKKNRLDIKKKYYLPEHKPIIMFLMGRRGCNKTLSFIHELINVTIPSHILICIGTNEKIRKEIEAIALPNHISLSIIGLTHRISDFMAISDLLITKPGSTSVCECIYANTPLLLDATTTVLPWERFNIQFIQKYQFGEVIYSYDQVAACVQKLLSDPDKLMRYKHNLERFEKQEGGLNIQRKVAEILD